ncbi:MAG: hypothetical protein IKP43_10670 [Bacteroidaceae bacterium]|nr:hypothetical protein [Bacteroidaceae bacterium]
MVNTFSSITVTNVLYMSLQELRTLTSLRVGQRTSSRAAFTKARPTSAIDEIEDEGDVYESIEEIWPDYPSKEDFLWDEEEC